MLWLLHCFLSKYMDKLPRLFVSQWSQGSQGQNTETFDYYDILKEVFSLSFWQLSCSTIFQMN